jgi:threonine synthase
MIKDILCINCQTPYPDHRLPYRCERCGGIFDFPNLFYLEPDFNFQRQHFGAIWKYQRSFGFLGEIQPVSLGEGGTPLVEIELFGRKIFFKLEGLNPTGSYKDRGSSILVTFLKSRMVTSAVEDSSGNAGASFAAYAIRAGIRAKVFVPETASGPKRSQIEMYGAEVVSVPGPRSKAAEAAMDEADQGVVFASHAYLPHGIAGYATISFEIFEQLGQLPGAVIAPTGQGNLLLGIGRGFHALKNAGKGNILPKLIGVQARACAPLWAVFHYGSAGMGWVTEAETLAEGVKVKYPLRGDQLLQMVEQSLGTFVAVDEFNILEGRNELARRGLYVEPTSAIVWQALVETIQNLPDPVVVILTGIGLKAAI